MAGLLLIILSLSGCSHRLKPPASVSDPVQVHVIDYGRHASLALPQDDGAALTEWSWGDWNWFALNRTGVLDGARALFASSQSTLSRRVLLPAASEGELQRRLGAQTVLTLTVERERASALNRKLEERWLRRRAEAVEGSGGRVFVPDTMRYSLTNNSVHELARWLRALGVQVSGSGVTANFRLQERASR